MATDIKGRYIIQTATVQVIFNCECGEARRFELKREIGKRHTAFYNGSKAWPIEYSEGVAFPRLLKCICGGTMKGRNIKGTRTAAVCDAACENAKGDTCACSCGRKNHGIAFMAGR